MTPTIKGIQRKDTFSKKFRECRESLNMKPKDFGRVIGMSEQQVRNIERGESFCLMKTLISLCDLTGTTPNEFLGYGD